MTARRRNHVFSLLFTLLVVGAVFFAYQARDTPPSGADAEAGMLFVSDDDQSFQADGSSMTQTSAVAATTTSLLAGADDVDRPTAEDGNLLVNGGFETPVLDRSGFATAPGWASRERQVEILVDGDLGIAADEGGQYMELNGRTAGRISQEIAVRAGVTYRWSFSHRARNDQDTVTALIDDEVVTDATSLPGRWRTASGLFVAGVGQDTVTFAIKAVDDGEFGNFVDNVRFEVQPGL